MTKSESFREEFLALLRKYKAEMSLRESTRGYYTSVDGVDFDLEGEVISDEYISYPTISFGQYEDGK